MQSLWNLEEEKKIGKSLSCGQTVTVTLFLYASVSHVLKHSVLKYKATASVV
jgi:hypothetical protein